jgi:hypothetical protein
MIAITSVIVLLFIISLHSNNLYVISVKKKKMLDLHDHKTYYIFFFYFLSGIVPISSLLDNSPLTMMGSLPTIQVKPIITLI